MNEVRLFIMLLLLYLLKSPAAAYPLDNYDNYDNYQEDSFRDDSSEDSLYGFTKTDKIPNENDKEYHVNNWFIPSYDTGVNDGLAVDNEGDSAKIIPVILSDDNTWLFDINNKLDVGNEMETNENQIDDGTADNSDENNLETSHEIDLTDDILVNKGYENYDIFGMSKEQPQQNSDAINGIFTNVDDDDYYNDDDDDDDDGDYHGVSKEDNGGTNLLPENMNELPDSNDPIYIFQNKENGIHDNFRTNNQQPQDNYNIYPNNGDDDDDDFDSDNDNDLTKSNVPIDDIFQNYGIYEGSGMTNQQSQQNDNLPSIKSDDDEKKLQEISNMDPIIFLSQIEGNSNEDGNGDLVIGLYGNEVSEETNDNQNMNDFGSLKEDFGDTLGNDINSGLSLSDGNLEDIGVSIMGDSNISKQTPNGDTSANKVPNIIFMKIINMYFMK